jgi:dihydrofolate reductase
MEMSDSRCVHLQKGRQMRKVIVSNIMSVDGFYTGPNENVMALNMDQAFDEYNLERIRSAGTVLLGRNSFVGFGSYWPHIAEAPPDEDNRAVSDTNREISRIYNGLPKVVVSDTYTPPPGHPWFDSTTVVARETAGRWMSDERTRGTGDILIFASHRMWNGLLMHGLVDELHLMVSPRALAGGTPLFTGPVSLTPLDARRCEGSDNLLLRYAPAKG